MNGNILGIEIGGSKLQIVRGTYSGSISERFRFPVNHALGAQAIRDQIKQTIHAVRQNHRLTAVGVGFGGPVDWRSGKICCSHHVAGWSGYDLASWIHAITECPVAVDNDANVAALAESRLGAGRNFNPLFYVTLGSGVGGGLVVDGKIYHGAPPGESEIGHVRLDRTGSTVESECAGWAVDRKIRAVIKENPTCELARLVGDNKGGEAKYLKPALEQNDPIALDILRTEAENLAFGLSHVVHLFHPEAIVIGGGLSLLGEPLRVAIAEALPKFIMEAFKPGPRILLAQLGEDAVPTGALLLASECLAANKP
ncbi:MAG: ROK family protein [Verrucomicrobiae bacterium]|nr:ROK family protein [Verrucomicrobiae bacterium]